MRTAEAHELLQQQRAPLHQLIDGEPNLHEVFIDGDASACGESPPQVRDDDMPDDAKLRTTGAMDSKMRPRLLGGVRDINL